MIGININEGNSCEVFIDPEDGTQAIVLGPFGAEGAREVCAALVWATHCAPQPGRQNTKPQAD